MAIAMHTEVCGSRGKSRGRGGRIGGRGEQLGVSGGSNQNKMAKDNQHMRKAEQKKKRLGLQVNSKELCKGKW